MNFNRRDILDESFKKGFDGKIDEATIEKGMGYAFPKDRSQMTVDELLAGEMKPVPLHERVSLRKCVDQLRKRNRREWVKKTEVRELCKKQFPDDKKGDQEFEDFWKHAKETAPNHRSYEFAQRGEDEVVTIGKRKYEAPTDEGSDILPDSLVMRSGDNEANVGDMMLKHPSVGVGFLDSLRQNVISSATKDIKGVKIFRKGITVEELARELEDTNEASTQPPLTSRKDLEANLKKMSEICKPFGNIRIGEGGYVLSGPKVPRKDNVLSIDARKIFNDKVRAAIKKAGLDYLRLNIHSEDINSNEDIGLGGAGLNPFLNEGQREKVENFIRNVLYDSKPHGKTFAEIKKAIPKAVEFAAAWEKDDFKDFTTTDSQLRSVLASLAKEKYLKKVGDQFVWESINESLNEAENPLEWDKEEQVEKELVRRGFKFAHQMTEVTDGKRILPGNHYWKVPAGRESAKQQPYFAIIPASLVEIYNELLEKGKANLRSMIFGTPKISRSFRDLNMVAGVFGSGYGREGSDYLKVGEDVSQVVAQLLAVVQKAKVNEDVDLNGEDINEALKFDKTNEILKPIMDQIDAVVDKLQEKIGHGIWGQVKEILTFLVGNEMEMLTSMFIEKLKKGNLDNFYVDDRVMGAAKPVSSSYTGFNSKVGKRDFLAALKTLREALAKVKESVEEGVNVGDIVRLDMKRIQAAAAKQGAPGQHWLSIIKKNVEKGAKTFKVTKVYSDGKAVDLINTFIGQAILGGFGNVPTDALIPENREIIESLLKDFAHELDLKGITAFRKAIKVVAIHTALKSGARLEEVINFGLKNVIPEKDMRKVFQAMIDKGWIKQRNNDGYFWSGPKEVLDEILNESASIEEMFKGKMRIHYDFDSWQAFTLPKDSGSQYAYLEFKKGGVWRVLVNPKYETMSPYEFEGFALKLNDIFNGACAVTSKEIAGWNESKVRGTLAGLTSFITEYEKVDPNSLKEDFENYDGVIHEIGKN